ncbi:MAG: microcin ABC transporter ATP-binding protein [Rhodospirillaceae bacterium]|nr:microcin ABC transporter ATP-binding protein [Alphaproteobacteria bacterium]MBR71588.1 microcin ABC transporter ATP-binding protein [Rhodospirillaceae bacterium]|tara:strand:- start:90 stop:1706 length:1617 start_codon:yes stop_codon:yes gene_type:complete
MTLSSKKLLRVRDLRIGFKVSGEVKEVVSGISFDVNQGETVAIVGESGSGKTISALSTMQLLPYPVAFHKTGSIKFNDTEIIGANKKTIRSIRGDKIAMIFQEPMTSLNPLHTIGRQVTESLLVHKKLRKEEARRQTQSLLEMVSLNEAADRMNAYPHELSGGQRQRVMIAMALACEPDLLIADEPTTALDVTVQAEILSLLKKLKSQMGMSILLITHDLNIVRYMSDRMYVMKDGLILEQGNTEKIFLSPDNKYTQLLIDSELREGPPVSNKEEKILLKAEMINVSFPIKAGILGRTVSKINAVNNVSILIREGQTLGLVGESGSGKTTLALALLRLQNSKGSILFDGSSIDKFGFKSMRPLRRKMQIVFQDPFSSMSPRMSVSQIILEGMAVHKIGENIHEREKLIIESLEEVGIDPDIRDRYPHEFSGGQRQRIAIARALVLKPQFLVLDEPTSALDMSVQAQIIDLLRELQYRRRLTYLFISHDLRVIRSICHDVIVLKGGEVVEHGSSREIFKNPKTIYTKDLLSAAFKMKTI